MMGDIFAHKIRVLGFTLLSLVCREAYGVDLGAGFSSVEEGDDRLRPAAFLHCGFKDTYRARLYTYGRDFGPVSERTILLSATRSVTSFKNSFLQTAFGVAILSQQTDVKYTAESDASQNDSENNLNIGGVFSVGVKYPMNSLYFSADWDSHVFPAGLGGIFLSTGRKQTISLAMGVTLK